MTDIDFPTPPAGRPLWLITLADLALLLVGFFVLVQATQHVDRGTLARGFRAGFGADAAIERAIPVAAAGMMNFARGSAALPGSVDGLIAWARDAARDPRVMLTVTGSVDGSTTDVDPATGSGAVLAADRARTVAAALAHAIPGARLIITTTPHTGHRAAIVNQGFAGASAPSKAMP
ncbi:flagellar motor protein MotB [Sphingomonas sp. PB2P19]|uniref:flagellar motor protein MotB n=1 Tax=Sphingomonas rhamnosi TaxID=3096156 RepID=UPI002FCA84AB